MPRDLADGQRKRRAALLLNDVLLLRHRLIRATVQFEVVERFSPAVLPATQRHDFVAREPEDPRKPISFAIELRNTSTDAEKYFLRNVLRVLIVTDPPLRKGQNHGPKVLGQERECHAVAVRKTNHRIVNDPPSTWIHTTSLSYLGVLEGA